ncbi:MAG: gamma-glutamylcyclotransferase family protein [Oscillatoria sp. PMC 1051.18]|nr:gamma-glutamylcyclotransferase family protein [Oscillatoria sp. PMC 1050.18]MEC5029329.1 gamma-glutamylcyclotransferase family protein [Oscillatoria sp. PMC 1051.18]
MSNSAEFLNFLQEQINNNQFLSPEQQTIFWETEKLVITNKTLSNKTSKTVILTPHASIISSIFAQLTERLNWIFDFINTEEFYQSLATAVINNDPNSSAKNLLTAIVQKTANIFNDYRVNVFVYGTLLPGEINHYLMAGSVFLADDSLANAELYNASKYPILIIGKGVVHGKHYQVPLKNMEALDKLEEHPNYYCREILTLTSGKQAWVYLGKKSLVRDLPRITSGNWYKR